MLNKEEKQVLRTLAAQYAEAAALPVQQEKKRLWLKLNHLQMERPMLTIDQIPWNEMDVDGSLICSVQDPYWRNVEWELRTMLYKFRHMPGDMVLNPYLCLPKPIHNSGWGLKPRTSRSIELEAGGTVSREFINQIETMDDVERIRMPVIEKLLKIRKLSCTPWSDREHFAEVMPDYCVMSNKPNPAFLAAGELDEPLIRADIRRTIAAAKAHNCPLELLLKDISTLNHNPACLWRWQEIAMEELQR